MPSTVQATPFCARSQPGACIRTVADAGFIALRGARHSLDDHRNPVVIGLVLVGVHLHLVEITQVGQSQLQVDQPRGVEAFTRVNADIAS